MDTITYTLFGLILYGAIDKREMSKKMRLIIRKSRAEIYITFKRKC
ncbi:hypothetical protein HNQ85_002842 [Anoxybacillus calidus]|jgi:hypothetical protein|uniref:Uncharacterized protein n=1 Tax=[Anoxybacillus] calidus TaxID=575178 RepID=A0A7W0BXN2_9BACL|nr:hypothetical protein [Anoxybacillus calidus]